MENEYENGLYEVLCRSGMVRLFTLEVSGVQRSLRGEKHKALDFKRNKWQSAEDYRKEVEASNSRTGDLFSLPSPYMISSRIIRVCLYCETATTLVCSIVDMFWEILTSLDPETKIRKGKGGSEKKNLSFSIGELEFDAVLKDFINDNLAALECLWDHRDNILFEISAMISSVNSKDPNLSSHQALSIAAHVEKRIEEVCSFIQSFLTFADKYLTSKLQTKADPTQNAMESDFHVQ